MNIINKFTLRTLLKNKTRTLVTIIGIALSVAMFTAVTSIVVSFQQYLVNVEINRSGAWEAKMMDADLGKITSLKKDEDVKGATTISVLGYAKLKQIHSEYKPYICVENIEDNYTDFAPVRLTKGRMPKNDQELVLAEHINTTGDANINLGDTLRLDLGKRVFNSGELKGQVVGAQDIGLSTDKGKTETLKQVSQKTYTVVGFCERPDQEGFQAPGFTAFTKNAKGAISYDALVCFKNTSKVTEVMRRYCNPDQYGTHSNLLRFMGTSTDRSFNVVIYCMGGILIAIIMLGSISLIYNAFSISVSERIKQFGLLKSIGATKKQMRNSVLFEALSLSILGIPLGLVAGLGGIAITLHYVGNLLATMLTTSGTVPLTLVITWESITIAVGIGLITILLSASIPARKAVKLSAIQAIRQSADIKIKAKKLKTSPLVYKLFGFEGMLASKNFKRNRRKYRATVISLFLSVVLFVAATSFSSYMKSSLNATGDNSNYDICCYSEVKHLRMHTIKDTVKDMASANNVDQVTFSKCIPVEMTLSRDQVNKEYLPVAKENGLVTKDASGKTVIKQIAAICFLEDSIYDSYLKENNLNESTYANAANPTPLIWDHILCYHKNKMISTNVLAKTGYKANITSDLFAKGKSTTLNLTKQQEGTLPFGIADMSQGVTVTLVLPYRALNTGFFKTQSRSFTGVDFYVKAKDHKAAYNNLTKLFNNGTYSAAMADSMYDITDNAEANDAMSAIVNIFAYGFIILISLICVANVFNTISTNVALRRQEFAMLKSVGMTGKGFNRMMDFECSMYGAKALLFGIPVSLLLNYLMYISVGQGWNAGFILPWKGILLSSGCVFLVVFATMLYAMEKVKKDNTIEALRNENL